MPITNVIVNGSFDQGSTGWNGTDHETAHTEGTYLGNGSPNRVAEMDGNSGQVTTMYQSFTMDKAGTFDLSFTSALRKNVSATTGEGFRVDVYDAWNNVIFTTIITPTTNTLTAHSFAVTYPQAGTYTLKFTELGPDNSYGAILDDVKILVCFAAGTRISTPNGPRAVETLKPGDLVQTMDAGPQPVRWIASRTVTVEEQLADPKLRPIVFSPGSLGNGRPRRSLSVSPLHRMLVGDWRNQLYFGEDQMLIAARALVNGSTVRQADPVAEVTYVHFLLDGHQIVMAEGAASESFYPSKTSLRGVEAEALAELLKLFPQMPLGELPLARPELRGFEARMVAGT